MSSNKQLSRFVRDALAGGTGRGEIAEVLTRAGWSVSEVQEALDAWADTPFSPPIPRPQATVSARDFFVYALTFGVLIFAAVNLVTLLHALIDTAFARGEDFRRWQIRWSMAVLIVTVPVYLWLTIRERGKLRRDPALYRSAIRKWLIWIALLIAAATLLADLVAVINRLLQGDLTVQFLLKALVVAGVAGGIFAYYLEDNRRGDRA